MLPLHSPAPKRKKDAVEEVYPTYRLDDLKVLRLKNEC